MDVNVNYSLMLVILLLTLFLVILTQINHSRETRRYQILKVSIYILIVNELLDFLRMHMLHTDYIKMPALVYVVFVGYYITAVIVTLCIVLYMLMQFPSMNTRKEIVYTSLFLFGAVATALVMSTTMTGFVYRMKDRQVFLGVAEELFWYCRVLSLAGFLISVLVSRKQIAVRLFHNWLGILVVSIAVHFFPLLIPDLNVFTTFSVIFFASVLALFHGGTYEEGTARMSVDMYRNDLTYYFEKKKHMYLYEIQIRNYDHLIERRRYTEEELDEFYTLLSQKLMNSQHGVLPYQKKHTSVGVIAFRMNEDAALELARLLKECLRGMFSSELEFSIAVVECPKYATDVIVAERVLRMLQKKCKMNEFYFCRDIDYEEYNERDSILFRLHDQQLEKQDVILYGRPIRKRGAQFASRFEILCRLQLAGNGIIPSEHVIKLAEQYGYIHDVNMAVLQNVCDFLESDTAIREHLQVTLHISNEELESETFVNDVIEIITKYELQPDTLAFEVTMVPGQCNMGRMREAMDALTGYRISFILSDFEPTAVNLESIMGLPFKEIKFERHCAIQAIANPVSFDVTGILVDLFKEQGYRISFKGIDNEELEEIAITLGADYLQGEKYETPFPMSSIEEYLKPVI